MWCARQRGCSRLLGPAVLHLPFFLEVLGICTEIPGPKRSFRCRKAGVLVWVNPCSSFGFRLRPAVLTCVIVMPDVVSSRILGSLGAFPICSESESSIHALPAQSLSGFAFQLFIGEKKCFSTRLESKSQAGLLQLKCCPRPCPPASLSLVEL